MHIFCIIKYSKGMTLNATLYFEIKKKFCLLDRILLAILNVSNSSQWQIALWWKPLYSGKEHYWKPNSWLVANAAPGVRSTPLFFPLPMHLTLSHTLLVIIEQWGVYRSKGKVKIRQLIIGEIETWEPEV